MSVATTWATRPASTRSRRRRRTPRRGRRWRRRPPPRRRAAVSPRGSRHQAARALLGCRPLEQRLERCSRDARGGLDRAAHRGDLAVAEEVHGEGGRLGRGLDGRRAGRRRRALVVAVTGRGDEHDEGEQCCRDTDARASSCAHRAGQLFGNQDAASRARAASVRPTTGANLNPWPEQADPTTMRPCRSRTKPSSAVFVYRQVSTPATLAAPS